MKVYTLPPSWKIYMYVPSMLFIAVFIVFLLIPQLDAVFYNEIKKSYPFIALFLLAIILISIIVAINTVTRKLMVDDHSIRLDSMLIKRELLLDEVKGYRTGEKYILIIPLSGQQKRIAISSQYINDCAELLSWLSEKFKDLDKQDEVEMFKNPEYGKNRKEITAKLALVKGHVKSLNITTGIIVAIGLLFPDLMDLALLALIIIPLIVIALMYYHKGLLKFDGMKKSPYPTAVTAILTPSLLLVVMAIVSIHILDYRNIWLPAIMITCMLTFILLKIIRLHDKMETAGIGTTLICAGLFFTYAFGTVVYLNRVCDNHPQEYYQATVTKKRLARGRGDSYYLTLNPWGPQHKVEEVTVSTRIYNNVQEGELVAIGYNKGLFDIPWFVVLGPVNAEK